MNNLRGISHNRWNSRTSLGHSQNHHAVAGGYAVGSNRIRLRTHPLPRGGSDCAQVPYSNSYAPELILGPGQYRER